MLEHLINPFLRAPMLASMVMCFTAALLGVLIVLRQRSLLAETLSHATYPGVMGALLFTSLLDLNPAFSTVGALLSALLAFLLVNFLNRRKRVSEDAALTFVLAAFFGMGVTCATVVQSLFPKAWKQVHALLYGQVATLTDFHIYLYAGFAIITLGALAAFWRQLQAFLFDKNFAQTAGIIPPFMEGIFLMLTLASLIIGMRSVGVVLVSAMLIAPAIFARALTSNFRLLFPLAGGMAAVAALGGNVISYSLSMTYKISVPIGPLIVLGAALLTLIALLIRRGIYAWQSL